MDVSLTLDGNTLVYRSPYEPALVAALKATIPASDRKWDPARKVWLVAPQHGRTLRDLTQTYIGEQVLVPQAQATTLTETRLLDIRYIGVTKDRGDGGDRTAFGWCGGSWGVVFPETALRSWFNAETRPGEERTLYAVLGVKADTPGAEIRRAYRRLSRLWHPDVCKEPDAHEQFIALQHAYEVLSDPGKRARYDAGMALAATARVQATTTPAPQNDGYRAPLRCGYIIAVGRESVGRFVVEEIQRWEDITDRNGRTLVTSWPMGAEVYVEEWL